MNKLKLMVFIVVSSMSISVYAEHGGMIDYATVARVVPVYESVARSTPHQECWTETVRYEQPVYRRKSATGTILGSVIGAAVGHNVGRSKSGRRVGRVAGAIIGASIGNDVSNSAYRGSGRVEYQDEQRCETRHTTHYEQVVVGYDVSYKYYGKTFKTRMDEHPGDQIPVTVDVRPAY